MHAASRSLASYFDDTSGGVSGSTTDWHDQMEASSSSTINFLGAWMYHPDHNRPVWVPESAKGDPNAKPRGVPFQEKPGKGEEWDPHAWGKDEYDEKSAKKPKSTEPKTRTKMTPDQRAQAKLEKIERKKTRSDAVKKLHAECYKILMRNNAWDMVDSYGHKITHAEIILTELTRLQELVQTQRTIRKAALKEAGGNHKSREKTLHEETTSVIVKTDWYGDRGWFAAIGHFCKMYNLTNTLGMQLPDEAESGAQYLSTASLLLSKAKEVIMDGILHSKAQKAKVSTLTQDECDFINKSYQAKTLINKNRGKDKPPQAPKKDLPDCAEVEKWKKHIRDLEARLFTQQHPEVPLPKHLQDRPPPKPQEPSKKKKGKGGKEHRSQAEDIEEIMLIKQFLDMHKKKATPHHHHPVTPSTHPPKGDPRGVPGPPRPPAGGRGRRIPTAPPPPPRAQSYMQGYTYYCD